MTKKEVLMELEKYLVNKEIYAYPRIGQEGRKDGITIDGYLEFEDIIHIATLVKEYNDSQV